MNFEEIKSEEIRSIIEYGKKELEKRESSAIPQEKSVSSAPIIVKFDEEAISQLSEIRSALTKLVPKKEAPAKETRDDEDNLDTGSDKQAEKMQEKAEKPEAKPAKDVKKEDRAKCGSEGGKKEEDRACVSDDKKEEDRACESDDKKEEDRACESKDKRDDEDDEEDRACGSGDKKEKRSLPPDEPQQAPLDEHQQEINSIIGSLKELFR